MTDRVEIKSRVWGPPYQFINIPLRMILLIAVNNYIERSDKAILYFYGA